MADLEVGQLREGYPASFLKVYEKLIEDIVGSKVDLRENENIKILIKNYFEISLNSLELCSTTIDNYSEHAIESKSTIEMALLKSQDASNEGHCRKLYVVDVLERMRMVRNDCRLLVENFSTYPSIHDQHRLCREKIQEEKKILDTRLKPANRWAKISITIFYTTYAGCFFGSIVEVALDAPKAIALALACGTPIFDLLAQWFRSHRTDIAKKLIEKQAIVGAMDVAMSAVVVNFEKMWGFVEELKAWIENFRQKEDEYKNAIKEEDDDSSALMDAMKEMEKLVDGFIKTIQGLSDHACECRNGIRNAVDDILRKTINCPNNLLATVGSGVN